MRINVEKHQVKTWCFFLGEQEPPPIASGGQRLNRPA